MTTLAPPVDARYACTRFRVHPACGKSAPKAPSATAAARSAAISVGITLSAAVGLVSSSLVLRLSCSLQELPPERGARVSCLRGSTASAGNDPGRQGSQRLQARAVLGAFKFGGEKDSELGDGDTAGITRAAISCGMPLTLKVVCLASMCFSAPVEAVALILLHTFSLFA